MFYKYILFFVHKILNFYNKMSLMIFKLYFTPYFYWTCKGEIIKCEYITYDKAISQNNLDILCYNNEGILLITNECDKLYNCYNRVINNIEEYRLTSNYCYTNYIFMNITLIIQEYQFTLYLRTNQYNFYVCDNIINSDFIVYYLRNILGATGQKLYLFNPFCIDGLPYKLNILDHCFNEHTLTNKDTITLHKNTFTITNKSIK
jgi:hypothetical protein